MSDLFVASACGYSVRQEASVLPYCSFFGQSLELCAVLWPHPFWHLCVLCAMQAQLFGGVLRYSSEHAKVFKETGNALLWWPFFFCHSEHLWCCSSPLRSFSQALSCGSFLRLWYMKKRVRNAKTSWLVAWSLLAHSREFWRYCQRWFWIGGDAWWSRKVALDLIHLQ